MCSFVWRVPLTKMEFRILVKKFLDNLQYVATAFKDNFPGEKWLKTYLADDPGAKEVLVSRGFGRVERTQEHSKLSYR